jgi:gluconate kinase
MARRNFVFQFHSAGRAQRLLAGERLPVEDQVDWLARVRDSRPAGKNLAGKFIIQ